MELPFVDVGQARRDAGAMLLLGTQRVSEFAGVSPSWKDVVEGGGGDGGEAFGRVLAALYLVSQAGRGAKDDAGSVVGPAPIQERPVCSKEMNALLDRVFAQEPSLVPMWCNAAMKKGVLPWPEHVPALLSHAANMPAGSATARAIVQAAGMRAAWLIPLNGAWKRLSGTSEAGGTQVGAGWEETTGERRVRVFEAMRRENPAHALEALNKAWPDEPSETRVKLLEGLSVGLSMGDEVFLEGLLDDKRKTVREKAAQVLGGLAESRLAGRMQARLTKFVRLEEGKLVVEPAGEVDKEMARDGLTETPSPALPKMGVKAWVLYQISCCVPLTWWSQATGLTPEQMMEMSRSSDWRTSMALGWEESWVRWPDEAWTGELMARAIRHSQNDLVRKMLGVLTPERHEQVMMEWIARAMATEERPEVLEKLTMGVVPGTRHEWSRELTGAFIGAMGEAFQKRDSSPTHAMQMVARELVDSFHAQVALETAASVGRGMKEEKRDAWAKVFSGIEGKLQLRESIQKETNS
jgi:hypothetical protein